ncbi:hypothetical protein [Microbacterium terregens]|uniref:Uncharacterized protein n=1 Tax=Microbacterium terregens TaxID=69363 RepID=A0ABV5SZ37_9MICO
MAADAARNPAARMVLHLQATAGNAAVATLISSAETAPRVQRLKRGVIPPPPVPPRPPNPAAHPGLRAAKGSLRSATHAMAKHPPPAAKAAEAAKAAAPPAGDRDAQAKEAKAAAMGATPPGAFDKAGFVAAVKAAIDRQSPKTLEDADEFGKSGKSDAIAADVKGRVAQGKDGAAKPIAEASAKPPDPSRAVEKEVVPIPPEPPVATPKIDAGQAAPARAPPEQTDLRNGPAETDHKMADAGVSEAQLRNSNEPEFTGALTAKQEAEQHSATAAVPVREREAATIAAAKQGAGSAGAQTATALLGARSSGQAGVAVKQQQARSKDEQERADVTTHVTGIFDATKNDVDNILKGIDPQVDQAFTDGEAAAKKAFTDQHTAEMKAFRDKRYSYDMIGAAKWAADLLLGPEPEVNRIFQRARARYESEMTRVINTIADLVGRELTRAKERVAKGRADIDTYVKGLKPALQKVGADAAKDVGGRFDDLVGTIDEKGQALAEDLANKYVEARTAVDDEITKMQEENKGLVDKAKDAVGGAIETILKLKDMLLGVLARAAAAVEKIIKDPIAFLGNLVNAVKGGIVQFGNNILTHLKTGLQSWLFGALSDAGIELPEKFDLKGVLKLVLSILGLTWESIRAKIAAKLPPGAIEFVEQGFTIVQILIKEGVGGLWKVILEKVGDIKEMVLTQVKEMVSIEIIKAGIVWLISLLNPASAFVKACKMIYDVVMFFVEKADQIKAFVDSILDSVESIAAGGVGAVAGYIEKTLGRMVPVLIGFLASLLGLGGISGKIKKILETIQKPVNKAIDWVIGKAVAFGKKALALGKKLWNKAKEKGKAAFGKLKKKLGIKEKTPEQIEKEKQARLDKGVAAGLKIVERFAKRPLLKAVVAPLMTAVRLRYRMTSLELIVQDGVWAVSGAVNPARVAKSSVKPGEQDKHVGKVAPHGSQPSPRPQLWSEHVIPRGYVNAVLSVGGVSILSKAEYDSLHTVLTYRTARRDKDFGPNRDLSLISGFYGGAKAVKAGKDTERAELSTKNIANAKKAFSMLSNGAVNRTIDAVAKDWNAHKSSRVDPDGAPYALKPDAGAVSSAAATERQEIEAIFAARGI